jgi:hypothetical protein
MSDPLVVQIGAEGPIPLAAFQKALRLLLGMLRNLDSALSESREGTTQWEVVSLRKASPAVVGISGVPREGHNFPPFVAAQAQLALLKGAELLERGPERTHEFSDAFLGELRSLARTARRLGGISLHYSPAGFEGVSVKLTDRVAEHVSELLAPKQVAYGSVEGSLDAINVHGGNREFRIWEAGSSSPISCRFGPEITGSVIGSLQGLVRVQGKIFLNAAARPVKVEAHAVVPLRDRSAMTIDEMCGLVDLTGGHGLPAFLRELRHEWD